jgi:phosphate-selective porin OprO/OprP
VQLGANADLLEHRAWQVSGSWLLTGERASYRSITPAHPFNPDSSGWGAVEIAARYGEVRADQDAFPVFANPATAMRSARSWGVGITWYLARQTKLMVNCERTTFSALGATARAPEHFLVSRVQVGF